MFGRTNAPARLAPPARPAAGRHYYNNDIFAFELPSKVRKNRISNIMSSKELAGFDKDLAYKAHIDQYYYNIFAFELPSKVSKKWN